MPLALSQRGPVEWVLRHREWHTHSAISPSLGRHINVRFLNQHLEQSYGSFVMQRALLIKEVVRVEEG
jgi:hypothetical protein